MHEYPVYRGYVEIALLAAYTWHSQEAMPGTTGGPGMNLMFAMIRMTLVPALLAALPIVAIAAVTPDESTDLPEEIVVNAPESMLRLRQEIYRAEDNLFDIYNSLNDDDQYDIKCAMEHVPGSRMQVRVCRPVYFNTAMEEEGEAYYDQLSGLIGGAPTVPGQNFYPAMGSRTWTQGPGATALGHHNARMEEKLRAVIAESPEFIEAVRQYNVLKEAYDSRREY